MSKLITLKEFIKRIREDGEGAPAAPSNTTANIENPSFPIGFGKRFGKKKKIRTFTQGMPNA